MKVVFLLMILTSASFAQSFAMKAINVGNNLQVEVSDRDENTVVFKFALRKLLKEGINIKHKSFMYNGENYVINIFANQNYLEKKDINPTLRACKKNTMEQRTYNIQAEISYSISLGVVEQSFLRNINVLEGIENIQYQKKQSFRCRHN